MNSFIFVWKTNTKFSLKLSEMCILTDRVQKKPNLEAKTRFSRFGSVSAFKAGIRVKAASARRPVCMTLETIQFQAAFIGTGLTMHC